MPTNPSPPAKRGGAGRGQGRKSLSGSGPSDLLRVRVDPALKAKCDERGPDWVREVLRSAK
jgi:hypothetical protein